MHYWAVPGFIGRKGKEREVFIWEVVAAVCEYYEMRKERLVGREAGDRGGKAVVHPRQLVFYFMERYGKMSMEEQARFFGYPHRSAVANSVVAVERRLDKKDMDTVDAVQFVGSRLFGFGSLEAV